MKTGGKRQKRAIFKKTPPSYFEEGLKRDVFTNGIIDANGYLFFVNGNENYIKTRSKLVPMQRKPDLAVTNLRINGVKQSNVFVSQDGLDLRNYERFVESLLYQLLT